MARVTYTISKHTYVVLSIQVLLRTIMNGMSTVTLNGLACGVRYTITAGGTFGGDLVGPRLILYRIITAGSCQPEIIATVVPTTSMTGKDDIICSKVCRQRTCLVS